MRFKLLSGVLNHKGQTFKAGQVLESAIDLVQRFGRERFQLLADRNRASSQTADTAIEAEDDGESPFAPETPTGAVQTQKQASPEARAKYQAMLDSMSTLELINFANQQEVDLGGKIERADVMLKLRDLPIAE